MPALLSVCLKGFYLRYRYKGVSGYLQDPSRITSAFRVSVGKHLRKILSSKCRIQLTVCSAGQRGKERATNLPTLCVLGFFCPCPKWELPNGLKFKAKQMRFSGQEPFLVQLVPSLCIAQGWEMIVKELVSKRWKNWGKNLGNKCRKIYCLRVVISQLETFSNPSFLPEAFAESLLGRMHLLDLVVEIKRHKQRGEGFLKTVSVETF